MPGSKGESKRLGEYRAKRDFTITPEPAGGQTRRPAQALAFCVQKHLASHLHYDFRLEHNGVLLSWAVPKGPSLNPADKRLAMRVEDHPLEYGEFEGVIPAGYGAGIVMLWDHGTWQPQTGDVAAALGAGELKFTLQGYKLKGSWVLVRTDRRNPGSRAWLLIKHRDHWSGDIDVTTVAPLSIRSNGDFADILAADDPGIWKSNRPVVGGRTGQLLADVIERAAQLKARRLSQRKAASKPAPAARSRRSRARGRRTGRGTAG
jgi:bifunctional non-homologous end joining protein LigD